MSWRGAPRRLTAARVSCAQRKLHRAHRRLEAAQQHSTEIATRISPMSRSKALTTALADDALNALGQHQHHGADGHASR